MQEEVKRASVERTMKKAGIDVSVPACVSGAAWAYRNKLALPFARWADTGKIVLGFFEKKSHRVVPLKDCPLHGEWAAKVVAAVTGWANECGLSVYDEGTGKGLLRHVVARYITTLLRRHSAERRRHLARGRARRGAGDAFQRFRPLCLAQQGEDQRHHGGESVRLVRGKERPQELGAFSAVVSPASFLQVNDEMRERLYAAACAALDGFDGDIVELYSGVGLLTAELALRLPQAKITAVEIVPEAVKDAEKLMRSLGLSERVTEICGDAADYMRSQAGSTAPRALSRRSAPQGLRRSRALGGG